jgi:rhamnosyltransferase
MPVVAVIPTYRPSSDLAKRAAGIRPMVDRVLVADDASPCTSDAVLREVSALDGVQVRRFARNAGIARSLNAGLELARGIGAGWLLTVDQDTDVPADYLAALLADLDRATEYGLSIGVIGPQTIGDASGSVGYPTIEVNGWPTTFEVFQTGALWSVSALHAVDGFDEALGIDGVDAAACLALRRIGLAVALSPSAQLQHAWGQARQVTILGRQVAVTNHSPERRTTMVRNRLRLAPAEFAQSPVQGFRSLRRLAMNTLLAVTVEDDRWAKAKASARGLLPRSGRPPTDG